jgi:hypothetical protein
MGITCDMIARSYTAFNAEQPLPSPLVFSDYRGVNCTLYVVTLYI